MSYTQAQAALLVPEFAASSMTSDDYSSYLILAASRIPGMVRFTRVYDQMLVYVAGHIYRTAQAGAGSSSGGGAGPVTSMSAGDTSISWASVTVRRGDEIWGTTSYGLAFLGLKYAALGPATRYIGGSGLAGL